MPRAATSQALLYLSQDSLTPPLQDQPVDEAEGQGTCATLHEEEP